MFPPVWILLSKKKFPAVPIGPAGKRRLLCKAIAAGGAGYPRHNFYPGDRKSEIFAKKSEKKRKKAEKTQKIEKRKDLTEQCNETITTNSKQNQTQASKPRRTQNKTTYNSTTKP
jgi:hypothetical protein